MSDQCAHGLAADWKQRSAMASASKVGGSYSGWRPAEPQLFSGHVRALVWGLIAAGVVAVGLGI